MMVSVREGPASWYLFARCSVMVSVRKVLHDGTC